MFIYNVLFSIQGMAIMIGLGTKLWGQTFFQEGKFVALR